MKLLTAVTMSKTSAIDERYLCDAFTNVPIRPMDTVVGLPFTVIDIIPFNSNYSDIGSSASSKRIKETPVDLIDETKALIKKREEALGIINIT